MRLLLGLMWLLHWLPLPVLGRLGEALGRLLFRLMRRRRHIALTNLRLCMPEKTEAERVAIARAHFAAYARSVLERSVLWWAPKSRIRRLIHIEAAFPAELASTTPVILLCPHFVCLEVAGIASAFETTICSMYTRQQSKVFDQALLKGRMRFNPARLVSRGEGIKPIIRALRDHMPYLMLPDMDFGAKDAEFVDFFGVKASTLTAPARLSASTGAVIVPVIATYLPDYQGWKVRFYEPWENFPGPDTIAATRRMNAFIEDRVREAPAEYFWAHKRFKTRPPGEPSVYDHAAPATALGQND